MYVCMYVCMYIRVTYNTVEKDFLDIYTAAVQEVYRPIMPRDVCAFIRQC